LFQAIFNRKYIRQLFTYPDSAVGFIQTFLLALPLSWGMSISMRMLYYYTN